MNLMNTERPDLEELRRMHRLILDYEIRSSWWASLIGFAWMQNLAASYFARKVRRKCARWKQSQVEWQRVKTHIRVDSHDPKCKDKLNQ